MRFSLKPLVLLLVAASPGLNAVPSRPPNSGFDIRNLDEHCQPCDDFYQFAVGGWLARNPVPPAYPRWGTGDALDEKNRDVLHQIMEQAETDQKARPGSNEQKIGSYYCSCMDEKGIDAQGIKPLAPDLALIARIKDRRDLAAAVAHLHEYGVNVFFGFGAGPDLKNSRQVIAQAGQGGLGLPDRDYYTKEDDKSKSIRAEYVKYIARMFELLGDDFARASASAATVMKVEKELASASRTAVELRDPASNYNKMSIAQLKKLAPGFSWDGYLDHIGLSKPGDINVAQPAFFKEVSRLVSTDPLATLKTYLRWQLINGAAAGLSSQFDEESFNLVSAG